MDDKNIRLIDANEIANGINQYFCNVCSSSDGERCRDCEINEVLRLIDNTPTVEARPVKHGTWKHSKTEGLPTNRFVCSECYGLTIVSTYRNRCMLKFCPNCGAEMEEDNNDRH